MKNLVYNSMCSVFWRQESSLTTSLLELRGADVDDSWVKLQHTSYKITILVMLMMM